MKNRDERPLRIVPSSSAGATADVARLRLERLATDAVTGLPLHPDPGVGFERVAGIGVVYLQLGRFAGVESLYAHSWVIWDVITLAWLMRPDWVPSELVRTPTIGTDRVWRQAPGRPLMREAYAVARDAIFADFFRKLEHAPG